MIGKTPDEPKHTVEEYYHDMTRVTTIQGVLHGVVFGSFIAFIVVLIIRGHRMSRFQWYMLVMVALLQILEVLYLIRYDRGMVDNSTCAHAQKMYMGAI